MKENII